MSKEKSKTKLELTVKIEGQEWTEALDKSFNKNVKNVSISGFRKGKCPRDVYEKKYGKESLYIDAAESLLQDAFRKVMEENKDVIPVVQPRVDIKSMDENGVEFLFTIITAPEVKIKKYKGLKVTREEVEVTQEEIDHEISHLLERYTELVTKEDGALEEKDIAVIDFEGFKDGVAFEGGKGENYSLEIGSHTFIPGFEEQLVGMKTGEEKEIEVTFPEDYMSEELKGQKATFKVKLHEIKTKEQRELDKEFFEDLGMEGVDSRETLEEEIKKDLTAHKDMEAENNYIESLLETVGKEVEVDIPEEMVEDEIDNMLHKFEEQLKMQGISLAMYYQFTNSDEKQLRDQMEKDAYQHVLYRLMLEEIVKLEKIEITDEEIETEIKETAKKYQMTEEEFEKALGGKEMMKYDLEMRKVIEILKEGNK
ncbi:MAG: trigger factor [Firmicutes bacterium]|nr:trigger factor [Bacillota bacterium]